MLFNLLLASETTLGTAETDNAGYIEMALDSPADMSWASSILADDTQRTGQIVGRQTDYFATKAGATTTYAFDWMVEHQEGLQMIMQGITEDTATPYQVAGNFETPVYAHGATTGEKFTVIVSNPDDQADRTMTGAVLTELTLSAEAGTNGGRLRASGTFMSGYDVVIGASTVVASGTQTAFNPVLPELTTMTVDGNEVILENFSMTFTYPAAMKGTQGNEFEPSLIARGNPKYIMTGQVKVKLDANADAAQDALFIGADVPLIFTGATWGFTVTQAIITDYDVDLSGAGAAVSIVFDAKATGSEVMFSIDTP